MSHIDRICNMVHNFCLVRPVLQDLFLYCMDLFNVPNTQLLTALTASSQLKQLVISQRGRGLSSHTVPLPRGALRQMFSPNKQWPSLQASGGGGGVQVHTCTSNRLLSSVSLLVTRCLNMLVLQAFSMRVTAIINRLGTVASTDGCRNVEKFMRHTHMMGCAHPVMGARMHAVETSHFDSAGQW
jgi:hypothetical protein